MRPEDITIIRSAKRRKTIQTKYSDGRLWIYLPDCMPKDDEERWIARMVKRHEHIQHKDTHTHTDAWLTRRANELNERYFNGKLTFTIRFVTNQHSRFGSCTHQDAAVRISDQVKDYPLWVKDYIIIHELAHLIHPNHSKKFWKIVDRYPLSERARGYLFAVSDLGAKANTKKKTEEPDQTLLF
jgi:predicted metal-dependent hydrolase